MSTYRIGVGLLLPTDLAVNRKPQYPKITPERLLKNLVQRCNFQKLVNSPVRGSVHFGRTQLHSPRYIFYNADFLFRVVIYIKCIGSKFKQSDGTAQGRIGSILHKINVLTKYLRTYQWVFIFVKRTPCLGIPFLMMS